MNRSDWSKPISAEQAHRRAGGRARYNLQRELAATKRRQWLANTLGGKRPRRGELADWARRCGVSKATICRDLQRLPLGPADPTFAQLRRALAGVWH